MRRDALHDGALLDGVVDHADVKGLEVADTTVDQLGGAGAGTFSEVLHFN